MIKSYRLIWPKVYQVKNSIEKVVNMVDTITNKVIIILVVHNKVMELIIVVIIIMEGVDVSPSYI